MERSKVKLLSPYISTYEMWGLSTCARTPVPDLSSMPVGGAGGGNTGREYARS